MVTVSNIVQKLVDDRVFIQESMYRDIISYALNIYEDEKGLEFDKASVKEQILEFFYGRLKNMFMDMGIRYDVVDSVLSIKNDDITDLLIRAQELNKWVEKEELGDILIAFNRVQNLSDKANNDSVKRELLFEQEELELYRVFNDIESKVKSLLNSKEYDKALDQLISLREPIDKFFDNIMVMVKDEEVKNNRLALIKKISNAMMEICDLSKIVSK